MGDAERDARDAAGLRPRCREIARRGPQDHAVAWLWTSQTPPVEDQRAQPAGLSRRRLTADRSAQRNLYRRRTRTGRNRELVAEANTLGFRPGTKCGGCRRRRPRPDLLRELQLQVEPQLHTLLRSRDRKDDRPAVDRTRSGQAQEARLGDRQQVAAVVRPIEFYLRKATCWRPEVKGLNVMVNSSYNGWRFEDVWLDK